MSPTDYLKAIRRRWVDVVLAVVVASAIGFGLSTVAPAGPVQQSYEAESVVLVSGNYYSPGATNIEAVAKLTTVGRVPELAAEKLGFEGEPLDLAGQIEVETDKEAAMIGITATSENARQAERVSTTFAETLVGFMEDSASEQREARREQLNTALIDVRDQLDELDQRMARSPSEAERLQPTYQSLLVREETIRSELIQLNDPTLTGIDLTIIQRGVALPVDVGGIRPPESRLSRVLLAAFLGLISGIVIVLLVDRFDTRIRSKKAAEKHFRLPVLAEIPFISRLKRRSRGLALEEEPRSPAADAFRMLATMLSMPPAQIDPRFAAPTAGNGAGADAAAGAPNGAADVTLPNGNGHPAAPPPPSDQAEADPTAAADTHDLDRPKTILVTSPGPSDGKTTVAANLAVAFGQLGKRVIVLSCDLRRPSIHRLFDVPNDQGLADKLDSGNGKAVLNGEVRETKFPNVWVVPSGPPPNAPGRLLASPQMRRALAEARKAADVTIVDTAPILTTSDAANLIPHVDAVVLIGRAGRTTSDVAQQTTQLIARLGGRVRGVVLNAAVESSLPRRYYYYRYYRPQRPKTSRRAKAGKGSPRLARHSGAS